MMIQTEMFHVSMSVEEKISFLKDYLTRFYENDLCLEGSGDNGEGPPMKKLTHHFENFYHHFLSTSGHALTESSVKTSGA